jgi:hypothetical protein
LTIVLTTVVLRHSEKKNSNIKLVKEMVWFGEREVIHNVIVLFKGRFYYYITLAVDRKK